MAAAAEAFETGLELWRRKLLPFSLQKLGCRSGSSQVLVESALVNLVKVESGWAVLGGCFGGNSKHTNNVSKLFIIKIQKPITLLYFTLQIPNLKFKSY